LSGITDEQEISAMKKIDLKLVDNTTTEATADAEGYELRALKRRSFEALAASQLDHFSGV
jgi:hypothetical protein